MDRPVLFLLWIWAAVDLLQIPLVASVFLSFRLSRRLGRAWRAVAVCFAGYAAWIVLTARLVPFSASGLAVLLFGMILDPRRDASPERVWALGSALALVVFWAVPVAAVWCFSRRRAPAASG